MRELRYFVTVVEEKSYTIASQKLYVSQPAISKSIKTLEKRIDLEPFNHSGGIHKLTKNGEYFYEQVKPLVELYDQVMNSVSTIKNWEKNLLVIGSSPSVTNLFLSDMMLKLKKKSPEMILDVHEKGYQANFKALEEDRYDFSVMMLEETPERLTSKSLYKDQMMAVFPRNNPLGRREFVTFEDVCNQNFFFYSKNYYSHKLIISRCQKAGYLPTIGSTHTDSNYLINVLSKPNDMAIIPAPTLRKINPVNCLIVPFYPQLDWELFLVYRKDKPRTKMMNYFMDFIVAQFEQCQRDLYHDL